MDAAAARSWFLRKQADSSVFGPVPFEQLARWAALAQISPNDSISADRENWMKAPMLPELAMDWIVEVTSERLYGPTTLGAIREFLQLGEIDSDTFVINSCDASRKQIRSLAAVLEAMQPPVPDKIADTAETAGPTAAGMSIAITERIRELEQALREERRALAEAEVRYRELEQKYRQLSSDESGV
ncbi:MAG: hypothetical protein M3Y86_10035 [Verrucomicrobiota bacterium]|nr:hypothetical protein [Verrucomicrobiota bacterium]